MVYKDPETRKAYWKAWLQTEKGKEYQKRVNKRRRQKRKAAATIRARNKKNRMITNKRYRENTYLFFKDFIACWQITPHGNFLPREKLPALQDLLDRAQVLRSARVTNNKTFAKD